MATDPRGLSGAVFQPTPLRDFIGDLQRQQQLTGQAMDRAAKMQESFFDEYGVEVPKDIPAPYLESYTNAANEYREESKKAFAMPDGAEKQKALRKLRTKKDQLLLGSQMAKERYATGEGYRRYLEQNGDKLSPEKYAEIQTKAQNFLTPQEQFKFYDDGALLFGDKTSAERFSENVIYGKPQGPKLMPFERIVKRQSFDTQNLGVPRDDGSYVFSDNKAGAFFDIEQRRGSSEYQDYLAEAVKIETGQDVSAEEAIALANDNPTYNDRARQLFIEDARLDFKTGGARATNEGGGNNSKKSKVRPFDSSHKPFTGVDQAGRELAGVRRGFAAPDNINLDVSVSDLGLESDMENEFLQSEVVNVIEGGDGALYADVIYTDPQRKTRIKKTILLDKDSENRISLELGLKEGERLQDLMPDVSGTRSMPQEEPQETEGKKKTAADILKTPKG